MGAPGTWLSFSSAIRARSAMRWRIGPVPGMVSRSVTTSLTRKLDRLAGFGKALFCGIAGAGGAQEQARHGKRHEDQRCTRLQSAACCAATATAARACGLAAGQKPACAAASDPDRQSAR
jgi:hypothetical protein